MQVIHANYLQLSTFPPFGTFHGRHRNHRRDLHSKCFMLFPRDLAKVNLSGLLPNNVSDKVLHWDWLSFQLSLHFIVWLACIPWEKTKNFTVQLWSWVCIQPKICFHDHKSLEKGEKTQEIKCEVKDRSYYVSTFLSRTKFFWKKT